MPSVQLHSQATEAFAAMRCVCVLTLRGAAAGACGDLPQLLSPCLWNLCPSKTLKVYQRKSQFSTHFSSCGVTNKQALGACCHEVLLLHACHGVLCKNIEAAPFRPEMSDASVQSPHIVVQDWTAL